MLTCLHLRPDRRTVKRGFQPTQRTQRIYELTQWKEHNEMTSLSIGQSQPPATTAYALSHCRQCGRLGSASASVE